MRIAIVVLLMGCGSLPARPWVGESDGGLPDAGMPTLVSCSGTPDGTLIARANSCTSGFAGCAYNDQARIDRSASGSCAGRFVLAVQPQCFAGTPLPNPAGECPRDASDQPGVWRCIPIYDGCSAP
jgi:hypothetical protein